MLAAPVFAILDWMERLSVVLGSEHLVTDVGSTKAQITGSADRLFNRPGRAAFLPGHPMAGKERGGAALADAGCFAARCGCLPMIQMAAHAVSCQCQQETHTFACDSCGRGTERSGRPKLGSRIFPLVARYPTEAYEL